MESERNQPENRLAGYGGSLKRQYRWIRCQEMAKVLHHSAYTDEEVAAFIFSFMTQVAKLDASRTVPVIEMDAD